MIYWSNEKVIIVDDETGEIRSASGNCTPEVAACLAAVLTASREYREEGVFIAAEAPEFVAIDESVKGTTATFLVRQAGRASAAPCRFEDREGEWSFEAPGAQELLVASLALMQYLCRVVERADDPTWWSTIPGNRVVFPVDGRFEARINE